MVSQLTRVAASGTAWEEALKRQSWIADKLTQSLQQGNLPADRSPKTLQVLRKGFDLVCKHANIQLPQDQHTRLFDNIVNDIVGFGPIDPLLQDDTITEVMVNGPNQVYVERNGKVVLSDAKFNDNDHVLRVINKIIEPLGRQVDRNWPMVDARLPDGSRVNAIIPPCSIDGPTITIRKFSKQRLTVKDLINFNSLTDQMADFLEACVKSHLNIVVSGGTGSGKTTLLNILSGYIPDGERIVTIEDAAELQLNQSHVVRLETKPAEPNDSTSKSVHIRDLVINSLRMRPERIIVGECRGGEALDMLQAMNTGHDGSLTTVHANTPRDTISRLETLVLMAGMDIPLSVVRRQITSAIHLIVQQARLRDGSRKVTNITEVQGMEGETPVLQDIFIFDEQGEQDGKVIGEFRPTGIRPGFMEKLIIHGFNLPPSVFMSKNGSNVFNRRR